MVPPRPLVHRRSRRHRGDPAKTPTPKEFPKLLQAMTILFKFKVLMFYLDLFSTIVSDLIWSLCREPPTF